MAMACSLASGLDLSGWKAYEDVEAQWLRDKRDLLTEQFPGTCEAAELDLELKLAELRRRGHHFAYLLQRDPGRLRGGIWQLQWIQFSLEEGFALTAKSPAYRRNNELIRRLTKRLREHPEHAEFRRAQSHLFRTPEYKEIHRKYMGRMQDLHQVYGSSRGF